MKYAVAVCIVISALIATCATAATRDFAITWTQELITDEGDVIPKVDGFRLYTSDGVFVQTIAGDLRAATVRLNVPFGQTCFKMRSFYIFNTVEYESIDSNVGACKTVSPGKPVAPVVK